MSGELHAYFLRNAHKRLHKWVHYFDIYEKHFDRYRGKAPTVLEIGVFGGGSLAMWRDYFGKEARIVGLDINPECKAHEDRNIEIFIGSQDNSAVLDAILAKYDSIDIVIDDGSHKMHHMIATFEHLYPQISREGCYFVEDTHTCYWSEYGGGVKREGSFIEHVKDRIDDINAVHSRKALPVSDFTKQTQSITVYDSVVVFERRPQGVRSAPITGPLE